MLLSQMSSFLHILLKICRSLDEIVYTVINILESYPIKHALPPSHTPLRGAQLFSVHILNHCFESTWEEAKLHRYNRLIYEQQELGPTKSW